jgi:hypothetical protein
MREEHGMTDLAWYTGTIVNGTLLVLLTYLTFKTVASDRKKDRDLITSWQAIVVLVGLMTTIGGTLFLYLQQRLIERDLTPSDTSLPILLWAGYYVTVLGLLSVGLSKYEIAFSVKVGTFVLAGLLLIVSAIGMFEYTVYWNEGAVLVVYNNYSADYLGIIVAIFVGMFVAFSAVVDRIEFVARESFLKGSREDRASAYMLFFSVAFLLQFIVPRAVNGSITNPVSVKIVGLVVVAGFAVYFVRHHHLVDRYEGSGTYAESETDAENVGRSEITALAFTTAVIGLYITLMRLGIPVLTVSEKLELGIPILFVGEWNGNLVFLDYAGCILPLVLAMCIILVIYAVRRNLNLERRSLIYTLSLATLLAFSISAIDRLSSQVMGPVDVLVFATTPVLSWIMVNWRTPIAQLQGSREALLLTMLVYCVITFTAFLFDITTASSPYGVIHVGGAGIVDGLLWAPILSSSVFLSFLVLKKTLVLGV